MADKLPRLKASEIIRILQQYGFVLISQRGSHQKWRHPESGKQVIVPYHKGKQLPLGTIRRSSKEAAFPKRNSAHSQRESRGDYYRVSL